MAKQVLTASVCFKFNVLHIYIYIFKVYLTATAASQNKCTVDKLDIHGNDSLSLTLLEHGASMLKL